MNTDAAAGLLSDVRAAMAAGNIEALTKVLLELPDDAQQALSERIGDGAVRRLYGSIRRGNGTASRGRVIVINGIFGARLDVGNATKLENIWVNVRQLTRGGFGRLRLTGAGDSAETGLQIRASGLVDDYLPLLMALRNEWDVLPFAFDWRQDIWKSADQLAAAISEWAKGEPAHIIAHSMGGLVARALTQRHRALWQSMRDGDAMTRGGRLVMLGTPNHGSYVAAMILSGKEPMVKALSLVSSGVMTFADTL